MSFPHPRQRLTTKSSRVAADFLKRLDKGLMIDRTQTTRPKHVKTVTAPNALARFFTPIKEAL